MDSSHKGSGQEQHLDKPDSFHLTLAILLAIGFAFPVGGAVWLVAHYKRPAQTASMDSQAGGFSKFRVPDLAQIQRQVPKNEFGESVLRGKDLLEKTNSLLPSHVGTKMACTSCHLNGGTTPNAGPWVGIVGRFPQYRSRSGKMDTLQDRVNDCFERSLNGKRLSETSREMTDIISYMTWLSEGYPVLGKVEGSGMPLLKLSREPNLENGKQVYLAKCASCHQADGSGHFDAATKKAVFPALWGKDSFNIGAGMARLRTAAGFVKHNMPLGQGGTLSDDEAWDVAAYFTRQERPDFVKKSKDWPLGGKPEDARY